MNPGLFNWRPVVLNTPKIIRPARLVSRLKSTLVIPAFTINTHQLTNVGASFIAGVFNLAGIVPATFAFVTPIPRHARYVQFVPAIKWTIGSTVFRYKLVSGYGEDFDYPIYVGETIPITAHPQLEIWTCPVMLESEGGLVICSSAFSFTISEVTVPVTCSQTAGASYNAVLCSPFTTWPASTLDSYFLTCAP